MVEGYLHLYYDNPESSLKVDINRMFAIYKASLEEGEKPMSALVFRKQAARELLGSESADVREIVKRYIENVKHANYQEELEFSQYGNEEAKRLGDVLQRKR